MSDYQETRRRVRAFIEQTGRLGQIADDQPIFTGGLVNSLFATQLVMFVEKAFAVRVTDEDLDLANFDSITAIATFVERKLGAAR